MIQTTCSSEARASVSLSDFLPVALLLLGCVLGSFLAPRGASATSSTASTGAEHPWRSVSAPATTLALLDYVAQPEPGGEEEPDTARARMEPPLPPAGEGQQPRNQPINQPSFGLPDTARHGDVNRSFPGGNPAVLETLGPGSANRPIAPPSVSAPAPVHVRGGILGLPPLGLLVGLIALHIFIVTKVVK